MSHHQQIILLGATGFTGRLVARELVEAGRPPVLAGRSEAALGQLADELGVSSSPLLFKAQEPGSLVERLLPGAVVINCVGPFGLESWELTAALAERPVQALDVSGEQQFIRRSRAQLDGVAREAGALLVHSCAFESMLADLLAARLVGPAATLEALESSYWFDRHLSSPGTRLTMRLVDHWQTVILRGGELVDQPPGDERDAADLPFAGRRTRAIFVPYPEVLFFARRYQLDRAASRLLVTPGEARLMRRPAGHQAPPIEEIVARHQRHPRREPTASQRARQGCGVAVTATDHDGPRRHLWLELRDPYGLTAAVIAWAAGQLLEPAAHRPTGVRSPAEVFDQDRFFEALASWPRFFDALRSSP